MTTLSDSLRQYFKLSEEIRQILRSEIGKIRVEDDRVRLGQNCFIVKFSELRTWGVLSAEFYDFDAQKQTLCGVLDEKCTLETQIRKLYDIAESGKLKVSSGGSSYTRLFHPDLCAELKHIVSALTVDAT